MTMNSGPMVLSLISAMRLISATIHGLPSSDVQYWSQVSLVPSPHPQNGCRHLEVGLGNCVHNPGTVTSDDMPQSRDQTPLRDHCVAICI